MSVNLSREDANTGDIVFSWSVTEYNQHERSSRWYLVMGLIGAGLLLFSLISGNYLFALIVVLLVLLYLLYGTR